MIVEMFLNLGYTIVSLLLTPVQLAVQPLGSMSGFVELLATASIFIPINVLGQCLVAWFILQMTRLGMTIVNWIIGKIPTIS